jgi:hypothetical protein
LEFHFIRFDQTDGVRRFAFDCVDSDRARTQVVVRADLSLARKYDIRLQDLPLLCSKLLAGLPVERLAAAVTLTEGEMRAVQTASRVVVDAKKRKPGRVTANTGQAWRAPQL